MQPARPHEQHAATALYRPVAQNLVRALSNYSLVTPAGALRQHPGVTLVSSGIRYAVFNAAVLTEPRVTSVEELTARLVTAAGFYVKHGMPWSCWVCRDHLSLQTRSLGDLIFQRHRLRFIAEHMGLQAERLAPPVRSLPHLDVRPVLTPETRHDFATITAEAFLLPQTISRNIYDGPALWRGNYLGYVGYAGGRAICTAATCTGPEGIGLYSVGTAFSYRGRGYAEAITRAAINIASESYGITRTVLQSTASGLELYQRLGYRPVTSILVYAVI